MKIVGSAISVHSSKCREEFWQMIGMVIAKFYPKTSTGKIRIDKPLSCHQEVVLSKLVGQKLDKIVSYVRKNVATFH